MVIRANACLCVVSTIEWKGRRVIFLIHQEKRGDVYKWRVLRVPTWKRGALFLTIIGLEMDEEYSK